MSHQNKKQEFLKRNIKKAKEKSSLAFAWQRPTLAGETPQLPSALKSLTSVFGMGTGVTSSPSSPDLQDV